MASAAGVCALPTLRSCSSSGIAPAFTIAACPSTASYWAAFASACDANACAAADELISIATSGCMQPAASIGFW